jgi:hypothetical protein
MWLTELAIGSNRGKLEMVQINKINTYQMLISGAWVDASDGTTFGGINPATNQVWSKLAEGLPKMSTKQCAQLTGTLTKALGVDDYVCLANMGLDHKIQ